ncbi:hypothetical protein Pla110_13310 [Polystyrenella longa]|uniref:DUF1365 domain-containing protein n=1 Tax=Polystyrenella longa TaxID=2528007 RepID=A0A518CK76_9PLAN|nr:DUF1365 domain-containing protein [Polystyrenella longa]QDU79620.1 hypothetical protein Pla110_13310 [Polystyrenella longa]
MKNSSLYEGEVYHHRLHPVRHQFRYRLYLLYLDLSELDQVFANRWFWSARRAAPFRFDRNDYLEPHNLPLNKAVKQHVAAETGIELTGPIRLLTQVRHFGFAMNPVSFYYCFDEADEQLEVVLAEVTNTPWGEKHVYVLLRDPDSPSSWTRPQLKQFHVSPFMGMEQQYQWCIQLPTNELKLSIENYEEGTHLFSAGMKLQRLPITGWNLSKMLLRYPFLSGKVIAGIYWQALRLWWKMVPFHPHPQRTHQPD